MNWKKFIIAFIAAFVFIFLFDWLFHGMLMKNTYAGLPEGFMRSDAEMGARFHWLILGQAIFMFMFTMIYARGFGSGGVGSGVGFGIMLGLLFVGMYFVAYCVHPIPSNVLATWAIAGLIEYAIAGAIVGAIYRPASSASI
jgi:hypothetical protein